MARKCSQQKQREMNLRGRSIPVKTKSAETEVEEEEIMDSSNPNAVSTGPNVEEEGRTKNVHDIVGIPELVVETEEEDETEEEIVESEEEEEYVSDSLEQRSEESEKDDKTETEELLQIQPEDVADEIDYWKQAVICFILGANPPWEIVEGFIRRIWTKFNIDKISFMPNGIFLVRFKTMEMKEKVLASGHYLFDNKPMIVKAWEKDLEMKKDDVKSVPAWIKIHKLPIKFWGKSLSKITNIVGKYVKCDVATEERAVRVDIEYEWRPVKCTICQGMGHEKEQCRKGEQKKLIQQPVKKVEGRSPVGHQTPLKRLVKMHTREVVQAGYSADTFGAFSYKEVAASPPKKRSGENGLFGLLETKIKNKAFTKAASTFSNWCITTNNGYHSGGRIWVVWKPNLFRVNVLEYNAQYIHMKVDSLEDRRTFWFTMVYAFNGMHDREPLWDNLRRVACTVSGPWAVAGDFNCVLSASERVGGSTPSSEMEPFRRCVSDCGVMDITAIGALFTWNNKQKPQDRIYSKLDRFLVNKACSNQGQSKRCFKYYNMWGGSKKFLPIVRENWDKSRPGTPMFRLAKNLKQLKPELKRLNKEGYSDIENSANILQKQVEDMQEVINKDPTNMQLISEEYEASLQLQELTRAKESFLSQKSKHEWIKDGDVNSSYFHCLLKKRRSMNKVVMVEDMRGKLCDTQEQVQEAFLEYYQSLLGTSQDIKKIHRSIINKGPVCNDAHWASLRRPVTGEEVKEAMFSIPDIKSPGPDGYTSKFFKDAWGECIRSYPKFYVPGFFDVLPQLVGQNQGAFIQQRSIQENILICQDLIRLYERPHASPRCLFKIDLQKAYDTVEWEFVGQLLEELKFPPEFIEMLMQCITTTTYSLSVNGELFGYFQGRLVIVRSVLNSLHSYWASIFILPKGIMKRIEAVCAGTSFGTIVQITGDLLLWDGIRRRPKEEGGLGRKIGKSGTRL
ncbi:uncharacterized protein LOC141588288 [Silene latifolia]|uniref:uncharacterized protein LOC141588288 n=1 Tax=Silene latifolia TaxID=37657 RepID=UPI003D777B62